jgi:hypothetical protein
MLMAERESKTPLPPQSLRRAVDAVMGLAGLRDRAEAEEILLGLARHVDRPLSAIAEDLADGRDFRGRPTWL